jgi:hypothetical protein
MSKINDHSNLVLSQVKGSFWKFFTLGQLTLSVYNNY